MSSSNQVPLSANRWQGHVEGREVAELRVQLKYSLEKELALSATCN